MATMAFLVNPKAVLFVALLCAAGSSFLPRSSSSDALSLITQTCRRTAHESLCVSVLRSSKGASTAATVQDLAVAALATARRATLRAKLRALDLVHDGAANKGTAAVVDLLARCNTLYSDCLRASSKVTGMVSMGTFDGAADAAGALRGFPERCEGLFAARRIASPVGHENGEMEEKLGVSYEIIRLLR
ncbi:hypothetical protein QOZ80_1AG0006870 [Eleusine coracana subsp. coracana]|nr:hypothetical protein QOZ80_1AG0006870 [Eleusine coracana subsp. coracana]